MSEFRERLKLELKREVPFTSEIEERLARHRPNMQRASKWPIITGGVLAILAAALFFLFQLEGDANYIYSTASIPNDYEKMLEMLKENEVKIALLDEPKNGQQLVEGADVKFMGSAFAFNLHDVIVEESKDFKRGDYVLFQLEDGSQYVRQVIGFEGETYKLQQGNVLINGKQLVLPGYINSDNYIQEGNIRNISIFFETYPNYFNKNEEKEATLSKDEFLISSIDAKYEKIQSISADNITGKVVGIQRLEPTFYVTDEAAEIYEAFKKDLDVNRLVGLDPVTMFKIYKQAELEGEYHMMHALIPTTASIYHYDVASIRKLFPNENFYSKEEDESIAASYYNGLSEATYEIQGGYIANVKYPSRMFGGQMITKEMLLNEQGFWENNLYK